MLAYIKRGLTILPALLLLAVAAQAQVGLAKVSSKTTGVKGYIAILDISGGKFTPVVTALDAGCQHQVRASRFSRCIRGDYVPSRFSRHRRHAEPASPWRLS
jgi:hypothetical protein